MNGLAEYCSISDTPDVNSSSKEIKNEAEAVSQANETEQAKNRFTNSNKNSANTLSVHSPNELCSSSSSLCDDFAEPYLVGDNDGVFVLIPEIRDNENGAEKMKAILIYSFDLEKVYIFLFLFFSFLYLFLCFFLFIVCSFVRLLILKI